MSWTPDKDIVEQRAHARERDPLGKAALFSGATPARGGFGTLTLECSTCERETATRLRELPSLLLPFTLTLPRKYHTLMRCPACGRRTWMRAHWRI
jgi:hypothetical protein